jgi:quinol monooxygenase YgiN
MIVEYIRYALIQHSPEELKDAYARASAHLQAAPECHGYDLCQCGEEPASLILRILWTSGEAHLQGFRKGSNFPPFLTAIQPFIGEVAEMRHYDFTPIAWTR